MENDKINKFIKEIITLPSEWIQIEKEPERGNQRVIKLEYIIDLYNKITKEN